MSIILECGAAERFGKMNYPAINGRPTATCCNPGINSLFAATTHFQPPAES